jgi:hypothetical protein
VDDDQLSVYQREMHYTPAMHIDLRAGDTPNLLAIAQKRAIDPAVFEEFPPFFFSGIASNNNWDSYETRMGMSSLANYAADADAGLPYLRSHNTRGDPVGGTLTGTIEGKSVREDVYIMSDSESLPYITKIRSGVVKDQSIGFYGGEWLCTICGRDMQVWWTADGCQHILGLMYPQVDKKGNVKSDKPEVMARANIENAHQGELSGVYAGATPGAMIDKARAYAEAGQLMQRHIDLVAVRYKLALPAQRSIHPVAKREAKMTEEEIQELQTELAKSKAAHTAQVQRTTAAERTLEETAAAVIRLNPPKELEGKHVTDVIAWAAAERARLLPLADDGIAYRRAVITEALTEGVRAKGTEFKRETYEAMLASAPIDTIRQMRDDWKDLADKLFPSGRQTADTTTPPVVPTKPRRDDAAYRA